MIDRPKFKEIAYTTTKKKGVEIIIPEMKDSIAATIASGRKHLISISLLKDDICTHCPQCRQRRQAILTRQKTIDLGQDIGNGAKHQGTMRD